MLIQFVYIGAFCAFEVIFICSLELMSSLLAGRRILIMVVAIECDKILHVQQCNNARSLTSKIYTKYSEKNGLTLHMVFLQSLCCLFLHLIVAQ